MPEIENPPIEPPRFHTCNECGGVFDGHVPTPCTICLEDTGEHPTDWDDLV